MKCSRCGSNNVATERRPNGNDICLDCHFTCPSNSTETSAYKKLEERHKKLLDALKVYNDPVRLTEQCKGYCAEYSDVALKAIEADAKASEGEEQND